ncbi:hypothetical protein [Hirschia maritima]|uniref:hypothetical protein n=1 Tax=Hirschia maritima TaxID=1121961 RepID=UPI00035E724F|nr:hypothetical protein [Hirschia maritima]
MKHHIMIALGLLLLVIFGIRLFSAIALPGIGFNELYCIGGVVLAGWLIKGGFAEWKFAREQSDSADNNNS